MQFQNPAFVATLAGLMVLLGANALGVFEISVSMSVGADHGGWMWLFHQRDCRIGDGNPLLGTLSRGGLRLTLSERVPQPRKPCLSSW